MWQIENKITKRTRKCKLSNYNSLVFDHLQGLQASGDSSSGWPPLFQAHGGRDTLVPMSWGNTTSETLASLGISCQFHKYPNIFHEMCEEEIELLQDWTVKMVPET